MADPKRVRAGKRAREIGKEFERLIARKVRMFFAGEDWVEKVRRSDQTHRAHLSDVTGWPGIWCECEHAAGSNPLKKLEQAEADLRKKGGEGIPVAVVREKGSRSITATLRLENLLRLVEAGPLLDPECANPPITMAFEDFLDLYFEHRC